MKPGLVDDYWAQRLPKVIQNMSRELRRLQAELAGVRRVVASSATSACRLSTACSAVAVADGAGKPDSRWTPR